MREHFLDRLLELPRVEEASVRRGIWRQSIAALGLADAGGIPMALAGVDPRALGRSIYTVLTDGLLEEMDFIAPSVGAVALYQIASALPLGEERRAIGRKVLRHLYRGDATAFAALASRMALASTRPLEGAGIRARVSLCMALRGSAEVAIDRMALAFVTRRELARVWICANATGALPDRRLAALLFERAAREAVRRALAGDTHPLRIFRGVYEASTSAEPPRLGGYDAVGAAWRSLLADRETLVWRHIAVARGMLAQVLDEFRQQTTDALDDRLTPTEWRRAATSLVAQISGDRGASVRRSLQLCDSTISEHDPGVATAMVWGLGPVAEVEPEAGEEVLEAIADKHPISIADSVAALRLAVPGFGNKAAEMCAHALRQSLARPELDDGLSALAHCIYLELTDTNPPQELHREVAAAVEAFGEHGTQEAYARARTALSVALGRVAELESLDVVYHASGPAPEQRRRAMVLLRDLDATLLETRVLNDLLLLDRPPGSTSSGVVPIDDLDARLVRWLLDPVRRSATPLEERSQITLLQRQLRMLLHLIDSSATDFGDDHERRMRVRSRWTMTCRSFVSHVRDHPGSTLTRAIIATVARAFDALVRDGAAEPVDVFLYTATGFSEPPQILVVAEASMHPDVTQLCKRYLAFVIREYQGSELDRARARLNAFTTFLDGFPDQTTLRAEVFRTTAWELARALDAVLEARSLTQLVPQESAGGSPLAAIEDAIAQLHQFVLGAERRCTDAVSQQLSVLPRSHALASAVENAVNTMSEAGLLDAVTTTVRAASGLPPAMAALVREILPGLTLLPIDRPSLADAPPPSRAAAPLPTWLPPRRILGGFYILHPVGGGNVGSVFVVTRAEERHEPNAQRFALKVPEYNATAARTMGEDEFLRLFREEAGALLSIPDHPNLAGFVTFDAGAKPKPILVMELVEGTPCERMLASQSLDTPRALSVIDGVLGGLEAMHASGIAHLDVKPSNAILRDTDGQPVLVDFGLAGRKIRPGCATLCYGAPEIWSGVEPDQTPATAADVYAVGCFAYEVLTGLTLFDGSSETAIIAAHLKHDGLPPAVADMAKHKDLQPLAMLLFQCLRREARERSHTSALRREFRQLVPMLANRPWPLRL
ncbi:MAG: serine/threonine protein kinase [Deltaproteobacteria bacterium]|jgi:hypothetical protein|nr:serine/threonine protein kinase [Deltaproteobacteria bacterium]MBW2533847.1 serine/threonine protein kinase [Deltaproteobacteria bacterium]